MAKIGITGLGVISALGVSVSENLHALQAGRSGIKPHQFSDGIHSMTRPVGEVSLHTQNLFDKIQQGAGTNPLHGSPGKNYTRTSLLALHAFNEAITDAGLTQAEIQSRETALAVGTTVGGMCFTEKLFEHAAGKGEQSPQILKTYEYDFIAGSLREIFGLNGPLSTINTACSSSANALMYGARLIRSGIVKRAIVGGADSLAKFTVSGFNALRLISDEPCRPFDRDRKGLNLGEGAAFLVLEEITEKNSRNVKAVVGGYGNTCDAYHPTSLSDQADGPKAAMTTALENAGLNASAIGYVNAHGTATENNDAVESIALNSVFGPEIFFSSTKAATGHTLGAAGALEAVFSVLALQEQQVFPSLSFMHAMDSASLRPATCLQHKAMTHVMSNSFGFGGNCTSLIFSKY